MKNIMFNTVAIILATGLVMAGIIALMEPNAGDDTRTISVNGEATRQVDADEAEVRFSVVTEADDAATASSDNADRMSGVVEALKAFGDVETQNYNVNPIYDYGYYPSDRERDLKIQFYRAQNTVVLKTSDLDAVGEAIDAAMDAGANDVDGVAFTISDELKAQVRSELLSEAGLNAKEKAESIADGLDVRLGSVHSVSEGNVYWPGPMYRSYDMAMESAGAKDTPIEPGTVDVQASVSVNYELR